jgi:hypothetical protein
MWIFSGQILVNVSKLNFHENPFSESQVDRRGRKDGQTGVTKLKSAFRDYKRRTVNSSEISDKKTSEVREVAEQKCEIQESDDKKLNKLEYNLKMANI